MSEHERDERPAGTSGAAPPGPVVITRRISFCAGHRYENPAWSAERNREVFGPCANPHGHGHNYDLEVSLCGPIDPDTGMVLNLRTVDDVLRREIHQRFDHRFINEEVEGFDRAIPTLENLCLAIWDILEPRFSDLGCRLHRVRLHESADFFCELEAAAPRTGTGTGTGNGNGNGNGAEEGS